MRHTDGPPTRSWVLPCLLCCLLTQPGCAHVAGPLIGGMGAVTLAVGAEVASGCAADPPGPDGVVDCPADAAEGDPGAGFPMMGVGLALLGLGALIEVAQDD